MRDLIIYKLSKQNRYCVTSDATFAMEMERKFILFFSLLFVLSFHTTVLLVLSLLFDMLQLNLVDIFKSCLGAVMLIVSLTGILGNVFTLCFVERNRSTAGKLVCTLAIFDLIFLITADFLFTFPLISNKVWEHYLEALLPVL